MGINSHVLQPHHSSTGWLCIKPNGTSALTRHCRAERVWIHREHIFHRQNRKKEAACHKFMWWCRITWPSVSRISRTASHSPAVRATETSRLAPYTCPNYRSAGPSPAWNCMKCLKAVPSCGFCGSSNHKVQIIKTSKNQVDQFLSYLLYPSIPTDASWSMSAFEQHG